MKPTPLDSQHFSNLEELKEGVCDSLINLTFDRISGFGQSGALVFGRRPSRHFVSGFLLPGFDPTGEEDETSDIRINTHGLDFSVSLSAGVQCAVSCSIAVYVRGLPEWDEVMAERYGMAPVFQPTAQIRREVKSAVKNRLAAWRTGTGQGATYADYVAAKQTAYSEECRKLGLPAPNVDLEEVALQSVDTGAVEADEGQDDGETIGTVEDALYSRYNTGIPDHLAEPMRTPEVWVRIPVHLGQWAIDLESDLCARSAALSDEIELEIRKSVCDWLETKEGQLRAYRDLKISPSDCQSLKSWEAYLERCRSRDAQIGQILPDPFALKLNLQCSPDRRSTDAHLVRIALEHHGRRLANAQQPFFEPACFQVGLKVKVANAALKPLPLDRVKPSYRYRHYMTQAAMGVNCGVIAKQLAAHTVLTTTWAPRYVLPRQVPRSNSQVRCDYATLSDPTFEVTDLMQLSHEYDSWIDLLRDRIDPTRGVVDAQEQLIEQQNFEEDLSAYRIESREIARGVDILSRAQLAYNSDPNDAAGAPYRAWIMMNQTFRDAGDGRFVEWRLFQIAFIIAQVPGFASRLPAYTGDFDPECDEETASLLYFATGGGKSEAFFGVLIYLLFLDRLRGKTFGVSALLRYPLRLLTVQQARRLFRILVRAELVRKAHSVGGISFQIGFWVGASNTPNRLDDERLNAVPFDDAPRLVPGSAEETKYLSMRRALNKVPFCPFCDQPTELRRRRREGANGKHRLALICQNIECRWNESHPGSTPEPLPFLLVDEDIYARAPSVILGTIDKLALIGQHDSTISKVFGMFGLARCAYDSLDRLPPPRDARQNTPPPGQIALSPLYDSGHQLFFDPLPSLVIQDEAHLLEESLGTFAGLFETTLEQVFHQNAELFGDQMVRREGDANGASTIRMPKIIAATATVSDPARQLEVIYQRECQQFPRPGPELYESFYSQPKRPDATDRLGRLGETGDVETFAPWSRIYVSFMTNGGTHTITTVNILAALHATITGLLTDLWSEADPATQANAINRIIGSLTSSERDEVSTSRTSALLDARDAGRYSIVASLVDLHRVVLTYVTNKKGGDVVLDALQEVSRETHRYDALPEDELKLDLISGGVDMEGIERVMRDAERDRTVAGDFVPLSEGLRNIVATSAISHGVDVDRFNSMVFAGIPSDIAEYIQASSRVGRRHVGFSLLVPTPQSRRDRYVVEVHRPFHRFLERMISPPAIDRWAAHAIKRVMPSLFQAWLIGFVEPRLFSNATDKSRAPQMWRLNDIRRYLEPVKKRDVFRCSFVEFALGAIGVEGRSHRHIGEPSNKVYYRNLVTDEARGIFELFIGPEAELAVSKLAEFWHGSTDVCKPMMSLRDVEEAGQIFPSSSQVGRKRTEAYEDQVGRALQFLRNQRASGSELDDESGG